jgi:WD40 repeat protein
MLVYLDIPLVYVLQVFETAGDQVVPTSELRGHEGPVWQVTWAHPKFGSLLASCGFDHKVIVWKELQESNWVQVSKFSAEGFFHHIAQFTQPFVLLLIFSI